MLSRIRACFVLAGGAGFLACASLAGIEEPTRAVVSSTDAGGDGTIQTTDGVTISPSELVIAPIECQETQSGTIVITNNGERTASYEVTVPRNGTFSLRGATDGVLKGSVDRAKYELIFVDAKGVLPGPQSVDVVVKVGRSVQAVNAKVDVRGGLLRAAPTVLDLGEVRQNTQSDLFPIELKNEGNEQLSVTGFSGLGSDFVFSNPTVVVPAGGTANVDVYMTPWVASDVARQIEVKPQASGATCADVPSLTLKGKRVDQEVIVSPLSADLGDAFCGSTPSKQARITVTNHSVSDSATFSAHLVSPSSRFVIIGAAGGSVPKAANPQTPSTADIVIGAKEVGLPLGEFDEDLQIDVSPAPTGGGPRIVKLHIGAYGALLEATPTSLGPFSVDETKSFAIKNVGNARTCVAYSGAPSNGFGIEPDDTLNPGDESDLRVEFTAPSAGTYDANVQIASVGCPGVSAPICAPPPSLAVSAKR